MSGVGACPRAVVAERLGHDRVQSLVFMERAATEGNRHEVWVTEDLKLKEYGGWDVSDPIECEECDRSGIHIELEFPAFKLVGHMDRLVQRGGNRRVAEIKALGRWRAEKLVLSLENNTFKEEFFTYAMQISCYHHASGLPILYCVKNRDTGFLFVTEIEAPMTLEEIDNYVLELELQARKGVLPKCRYRAGDFERTICNVKYMCAGDDEEVEISPDAPTEEELAEAAALWKVGKSAEQEAKNCADTAKQVFGRALKASNQKSMYTNGLRLTLVPAGKSTSYPVAKLKQVVDEELLSQVREEKSRSEYIKVEEA